MEHLNAYPQFYDLAAHRYSCRNYLPEPVSRDMVMAVLDAARLAPSACNRQPWTFLVLDTPESRRPVLDSYQRDFIKPVGTFIVALAHHDASWHRPEDGKDHADIDVAIAVEHICLAATSLGLGTCWICNFDPATLTRGLNLPEGVEPVAIIPLGYPAPGSEPAPKKRKDMSEIVRWEKF